MVHGDAPEILQPCKQALHDIAFTIKAFIVRDGDFTYPGRGDAGGNPTLGQVIPESLAVMDVVSNEHGIAGRCSRMCLAPFTSLF